MPAFSCLRDPLLILLLASALPAGAVTITPSAATVKEGARQQFTASTASIWKASCGSITSAGLYSAPLAPRFCTVTATATNGSGSATAKVTVVSPIVLTPTSAKTPQNQTQRFAASTSVTWSAKCGSISSSGLFTASAPVGSRCTIEAIATTSPHYTAFASDTITARFAISPTALSLKEGATQQFTANYGATWTSSCGTISPGTGLYTAPLVPETCKVTGTATNGSGANAVASVTITSPISITPANAMLHAIGTVQFTASVPVTWSASCGSISATGLFTAPATAGTCSITAAASSGTRYTALAPAVTTILNYTRYKGDMGGTGAQQNEVLLTPANVNAQHFGQKWAATLDGGDGVAYAQPLYMNGLSVNGTPLNVLFIATSDDSVYAFNADTGKQIWKSTFLSPGVTPVSPASISFPDKTGVLGTPVIDPVGKTLYVVAETSENNATYFPHRLHALDLATGAEKAGSPVLISDPALVPVYKFQRPGLVLANNTVYVAFGSVNDNNTPPYHGLLFGFDPVTLARKAFFNVTPTGSEGALWNSGAAPVTVRSGKLYVSTANGTFDGINNYGQSIVKLSPSLQVLDYFTPFDYNADNTGDIDVGSGNIVVVPDQTGPFPHELIACGKPSPIYLMNRDSMGKVGTTSDNILQRLDKVIGNTGSFRDSGQPCYNSPAFWRNNVYFVANHDVLKMFTLSPTSGLLSTAPVARGAYTYLWPGATPVISSNGTNNGIVWTLDRGAGTLRANDAANVSTVLYVSPALGSIVKFTLPTVANGFVYVGLKGKVVAYTITTP